MLPFRPVALVLGVLTLVLVGCGSRVDPALLDRYAHRLDLPGSEAPTEDAADVAAAAPKPEPTTDATSRTAVGSPTPAEVVTEPTEGGPESPVAAARGGSDEEMPLAVSVEPGCVAAGDEVTATIETEPNASLTMAVAYSDYYHHGDMQFTEADGAGRLVWRWTIGPDIPPGRSFLMVSAGSRQHDRSTNGWAEFTVAGVEGAC